MTDDKTSGHGSISAVRMEKTPLMVRAAVHVAGRPVFHVLRRDAVRLTIGDRVTDAAMEELQRRYQRRGAYLQAIRFLGPRDRSAGEVTDHLRRKGWDPAACAEALARLRGEGYVDDARFARAWVAYRGRTAPRSRAAMSQELEQKGIARPIIQEAVAAMDDAALALACARKKRRQWQRYDDDERRRRILTFLQRKGFPFAACRMAAETLAGQIPDD